MTAEDVPAPASSRTIRGVPIPPGANVFIDSKFGAPHPNAKGNILVRGPGGEIANPAVFIGGEVEGKHVVTNEGGDVRFHGTKFTHGDGSAPSEKRRGRRKKSD